MTTVPSNAMANVPMATTMAREKVEEEEEEEEAELILVLVMGVELQLAR